MGNGDDWPTFNHYGSAKHLVAIGAISAIWNDLEALTKGLISLLIEENYVLTDHITEKLNIDEVIEIINIHLLPILNNETKDNLLYFLRCVLICKENPNILLHSIITADHEGGNFLAIKGMNKQRTREKTRAFSAEELRLYADEMFDILQYGRTIFHSAINYIFHIKNNDKIEYRQFVFHRPSEPNRIILNI